LTTVASVAPCPAFTQLAALLITCRSVLSMPCSVLRSAMFHFTPPAWGAPRAARGADPVA
jgi:hypothetical protein